MVQNYIALSFVCRVVLALLLLPVICVDILFVSMRWNYSNISASLYLGLYAAILVLWALSAIWIIKRRFSIRILWIQDMLVLTSLFAIIYLDYNQYVTNPNQFWFIATNTLDYIALASVPLMVIILSSSCLRISRKQLRPRVPLLSQKNWRSLQESNALIHDVRQYIFKSTIFRKHSFEPTVAAFLRGVLAVYCCMGFIGYLAGSIMVLPAPGTVTIFDTYNTALDATLQPSYPGKWYLKAVVQEYADEYVPGSTSDDGTGMIQSWSINSTSTSSAWSPDIWAIDDPDIWPINLDTKLTLSTNSTVALWLTLTGAYDKLSIAEKSPPRSLLAMQKGSLWKYTTPIIIDPNTSVEVMCTWTVITYESFKWLSSATSLAQQNKTDTPGTSTIAIRYNPSQGEFPGRKIVPQEGVQAIIGIISSFGGIYSLVEGIFAFIFGRSLISIITGSRPISPFGVIGILLRRRFRRLINEQFPLLRGEFAERGLASFIKEVAIDVDFISPTGEDQESKERGADQKDLEKAEGPVLRGSVEEDGDEHAQLMIKGSDR